MHRRQFIGGVSAYASALALLPYVAQAEDAARNGNNIAQLIIGDADIRTTAQPSGKKFVEVQGGDSHALMKLGKNAFLVKPKSQISFETDESGMHVRAARLLKGAVHSAFDPKDKGARNVLTSFATIAIRGTAHYAEVQEAEQRTYSCCCYGHVHVQATKSDAALTQKTRYHQARIITADGVIEAAPYAVPLNHYDDTLVELERCVSRKPRWILPGGKLNFFAPFAFTG